MILRELDPVLDYVKAFKTNEKKRFKIIVEANYIYLLSPKGVNRMIIKSNPQGGYDIDTLCSGRQVTTNQKSFQTVQNMLKDVFA